MNGQSAGATCQLYLGVKCCVLMFFSWLITETCAKKAIWNSVKSVLLERRNICVKLNNNVKFRINIEKHGPCCNKRFIETGNVDPLT